MTNLIFSIVVAVVTNVTEQVEPARSAGYVLTSNPPQYPMLPASKTVTTTVCRVTNFVSLMWTDFDGGPTGLATTRFVNGPNPKLIFESGRVVLSQSTEHFTEAVEKTWVKNTNAGAFYFNPLLGRDDMFPR